MKKLFAAVTFGLVLALLLSACGEESDEADGATEAEGAGTEEATPETEEAESDTEEESSETSDKESEEVTGTSNEVYEDDEYKFVFGEAEQIDGEYDTQVLAIEVEFMNNSDEAQSPWFAAAIVLDMSEVTEVTTESVMGGIATLPEDYKSDLYRMDTEINSGQTVETILALEIQNPGSTFEISDRNLSGEPQFEWEYETQETSE